ncbi:MAG TPA: hypothetical protein VKY57_02005 [Chitinispirillaceae bacterium]|nr:hypothetical protein [Chitinispirillaceae bacterium]
MIKKALIWMLAAGCCIGSYATDARVISMGKHDAFFMDEVSIFRNPANINLYSNMVYGSYGVYKPDPELDYNGTGNQLGSLARTNRDPSDPFFGAIISYSMNQNSDDGNRFPMLSVGAVFNRKDRMLDYVTKGTDKYLGKKNDEFLDPLGKVDLLMGYTFQNGGMIGGGVYAALQKHDSYRRLETTLYKGQIGMNWPIAKTMDMDISLGGGMLTAIADSAGYTKRRASRDLFGTVEGRLFSKMAGLNGDFVPHARLDVMSFEKDNIYQMDVAAGIGLNLRIDKGFFWSGIEFLYGQKDSSNSTARESVGGRVSFGIERSIWWDWFVIRVGGKKDLVYITEGVDVGFLKENNPSDGSEDDLVGLGFGINIENRLRIDVVAAEDIVYTFTNLFSGPQHHLFNRVSATYSF